MLYIQACVMDEIVCLQDSSGTVNLLGFANIQITYNRLGKVL